MSDYISLDIAKQQLRIRHDRDDEYIKLLIKAALKAIENFIDRPFSDVEIAELNELPADLVVAGLLIITDMYENRAAQTEVNLYVNRAVEFYMLPYRKMGV